MCGCRNTGWEFGGKVTLAAAIDTGVVSADTQNTTPPPPAPQPVTEGTDANAVVDLFLNWKPQYGFLDGTDVRLGIDNLLNADFGDNQSPDRSKARTSQARLRATCSAPSSSIRAFFWPQTSAARPAC